MYLNDIEAFRALKNTFLTTISATFDFANGCRRFLRWLRLADRSQSHKTDASASSHHLQNRFLGFEKERRAISIRQGKNLK